MKLTEKTLQPVINKISSGYYMLTYPRRGIQPFEEQLLFVGVNTAVSGINRLGGIKYARIFS